MKGRTIKKLIVYGAIVLPIYCILIMCTLTGAINPLYRGFAVDDNGLLYVGKDSKIDVYDNGEFVKTFHDHPGSYYRIKIHDEHLYIVTLDSELEMDLMGNIIEKRNLSNTKELSRLSNQRNMVITDDATYIAREVFAYYKITKYYNNGEKEKVFQSPIIDFLLQMVGIIGFVSFISIVLIVRFKWLIKEKEKQYRGEK